MPIRRPARRMGKEARGYWPKLVEAQGRPVLRWAGVERDDRCSFESKYGSLLLAQECVWRQGKPSAKRIRRTWLRAILRPRARAAAVRAFNVQCAASSS